MDGWDAAQEALKVAFPGITLQEWLRHATTKLALHLATYKRRCKAAGQPLSEQEETRIYQAFVKVLPSRPSASAYPRCLPEGPG